MEILIKIWTAVPSQASGKFAYKHVSEFDLSAADTDNESKLPPGKKHEHAQDEEDAAARLLPNPRLLRRDAPTAICRVAGSPCPRSRSPEARVQPPRNGRQNQRTALVGEPACARQEAARRASRGEVARRKAEGSPDGRRCNRSSSAVVRTAVAARGGGRVLLLSRAEQIAKEYE